jgi:hypothetical protein
MGEKIKTIQFLLIGSLFFLIGCNTKDIDYVVKADWVYVNNSNHSIEVQGSKSFMLPVLETYTIHQSGEGSKDITEESYYAPLSQGATKIIFDGNKEITITGSITDRTNYVAEKLALRHYRFTYVFTNKNYPNE